MSSTIRATMGLSEAAWAVLDMIDDIADRLRNDGWVRIVVLDPTPAEAKTMRELVNHRVLQYRETPIPWPGHDDAVARWVRIPPPGPAATR